MRSNTATSCSGYGNKVAPTVPARADAAIRDGSKKPAALTALALAVVAGIAQDFWLAQGQYQFL
jgi:hypothetical protein